MGIFIFRGRRDETWYREISCRPDSGDVDEKELLEKNSVLERNSAARVLSYDGNSLFCCFVLISLFFKFVVYIKHVDNIHVQFKNKSITPMGLPPPPLKNDMIRMNDKVFSLSVCALLLLNPLPPLATSLNFEYFLAFHRRFTTIYASLINMLFSFVCV